MTLIVPFIGEVDPTDVRLMRLAEFLGVATRKVPAEEVFSSLESLQVGDNDCLVMNPRVVCRSLVGETSMAQRMGDLRHRFSRMLVHCVSSDPLHNSLIISLTAGEVKVSQRVPGKSETLSIAQNERDICGHFSGLAILASLGAEACAFHAGESGRCRGLITCGEDALFAIVTVEQTEILLLGSGDVLDLESEGGDGWLNDATTRLVPHAMALRYISGEGCWRPAGSHACVIIDDPLLRPRYGFLDFDHLLTLTDQQNFAVTIAFIPHNFRRNSRRVVAMFREHAQRLSICFHGNDHTGGEFASTDAAILNTMLGSARSRMLVHEQRSRLRCDPVMVFPQGKFSIEAMAALRSHNFVAAINTGARPQGEQSGLTFRELAQPAVLRYAGFPLFLRRYSADTQGADIAFRLFFGIPIFIVEHHEVFADPARLLDAVGRVNRLAPNVRWCSAADASMRSILQKRESGDQLHVKAYARTVHVENRSSVPENIRIEWTASDAAEQLESAFSNQNSPVEYVAAGSSIWITASLDAESSDEFSIRDVPSTIAACRQGVRHSLHVFVRRRLSELRDNYICKSPRLLAAAKSIQKSMQH